MSARKIKEGVFAVGVNDWDRRIFDNLIPLPDGTSYNAYIIKGSEKTALIDTVDPPKKDELLENLKSINIENIDYIIANHAEQDHSGSIGYILEAYPGAKVVANQKCKDLLKSFLLIEDDKFVVVNDGDSISLGDKTIEFIFTPWVHWPETMVSYLVEDKILFSCDFFGSHRATSHLFADDEYKVIEDAKRYYAEIMMPFRKQIIKNIQRISDKEIEIIAPSHGPLYNKPSIIIDAYKEWVSDNVKSKLLIPYISMHDSTTAIVNYITDKMMQHDIEVLPINLAVADIGVLTMELVDASAIIIATPYVLGGAHPLVIYAAYLVNALRPKTKYISVVASYGWGGQGVEQIKNMLASLKAEFIEPVKVKGYPDSEDYVELDRLIGDFADKMK